MDILPAWMFVYHFDVWCLGRPEEGVLKRELGAGN